jgi:hypothetical protein
MPVAVTNTPTGAVCDVTTPLPAITDIHPDMTGVKVLRFQAPENADPQFRGNWSELRHDKKYMGRLRNGYQALLQLRGKTGLWFQTSLHRFYCSGGWTVSGVASDVHSNWLFLPWHRAFIYFHELALRRVVGDDFRLPVWDWENDASIPEFYYKWLGIPSFLSVGCYSRPHINGLPLTNPCILQAWLFSNAFEDFCGKSPSQSIGGLATYGPHSSVHMYLAGGAMPVFDYAAADPIFYSHHANIDRFWSYWMTNWRNRHPDQKLPADWLETPMYFYDQIPNPKTGHLEDCLVEIHPNDLIDESRLGYKYQKPSIDPLTSAVPLDLQNAPVAWNLISSAFGDVYPILRPALRGITGLLMELGVLSGLQNGLNALVGLAGDPQKIMTRLLDNSGDHEICLPAQFNIKVKADPGYYLLTLSSGSSAGSPSASANVGAFGIFSSHQHDENPSAIPVALALPLKMLIPVLNAVLHSSMPLRLTYQKLAADSMARDFASLTGAGEIHEVFVTGFQLIR